MDLYRVASSKDILDMLSYDYVEIVLSIPLNGFALIIVLKKLLRPASLSIPLNGFRLL